MPIELAKFPSTPWAMVVPMVVFVWLFVWEWRRGGFK